MSNVSERPSLDMELCNAIDNWRKRHPDLTIMDTLTSLEKIRYLLTELYLEHVGLK